MKKIALIFLIAVLASCAGTKVSSYEPQNNETTVVAFNPVTETRSAIPEIENTKKYWQEQFRILDSLNKVAEEKYEASLQNKPTTQTRLLSY